MSSQKQKSRIVAFSFFLLILSSLPAYATSLEFAPLAQTVNLGSSASVDIVFADPGGNLVGAYDFNVHYDPAILSINNVAFGSGLGFPVDSFTGTVSGPSQINVFELSLLFDFTGYQDGISDLTLFSLTFDTIGLGTSILSFSENIFGATEGFLVDGNFPPETIALDSLGTGSIEVIEAAVVIPEPGTLVLVGLGLSGLALLRLRKR